MAAEQAQGKVEASVFAIITAFTSGLDVYRKLRERRGRKKKSRKAHCSRSHSTIAPELSDDELQLSNSLHRGPVEIQDRYQLNRRHAGQRFAQGDSIAHASLTEVLLKLNTGLVAIISSFLCHGKNESNLDYRGLAHLADCSRSEAVDALDQLYQRLAQSQISLDGSRSGRPFCPNYRSQQHADCGIVIDPMSVETKKPSLVAVKQQAAVHDSAAAAAATAPPSASTKAPRQKSSKSQLVMVRPRKSSRLKLSSSISVFPSGRTSATAGNNIGSFTSPSRSPSPPPRPDAATAIAAAAAHKPHSRLHKLSKKNALRSMTSLAAEPIPEHALPTSPLLPLTIRPPPYPGLPPHASNYSSTARRPCTNDENARNGTNAGPPKPPKIPPMQNQKEANQRSAQRAPSSTLLPYSSYPAAQHPLPTNQRSHSRLRPQRHSSMPPIPLASTGPLPALPRKTPPPQPLQQRPHQQPQLQPADSHHQTPNANQLTIPPASALSSTLTPHPEPPPPHPAPPRRRSTAPVPASIYSFTSDSTKLGEIPMSRWANGPWDAERAARLNAAAGWADGIRIAGSLPLAVEATAGGSDAGRMVSGGSDDADQWGAGGVAVERKKRGGRGGRLGALWRWGSSGSDKEKERDRDREKKVRA